MDLKNRLKSENMHDLLRNLKLKSFTSLKLVRSASEDQLRVLIALIVIYKDQLEDPRLPHSAYEENEGVNFEIFKAYFANATQMFKRIESTLKILSEDGIRPENIKYAKGLLSQLPVDFSLPSNSVNDAVLNILEFVRGLIRYYDNNFSTEAKKRFSFSKRPSIAYVPSERTSKIPSVKNVSNAINYDEFEEPSVSEGEALGDHMIASAYRIYSNGQSHRSIAEQPRQSAEQAHTYQDVGNNRNSIEGDKRKSISENNRNSIEGNNRKSISGDKRNSIEEDKRNSIVGRSRDSLSGNSRNNSLGNKKSSNAGSRREVSAGSKREVSMGSKKELRKSYAEIHLGGGSNRGLSPKETTDEPTRQPELSEDLPKKRGSQGANPDRSQPESSTEPAILGVRQSTVRLSQAKLNPNRFSLIVDPNKNKLAEYEYDSDEREHESPISDFHERQQIVEKGNDKASQRKVEDNVPRTSVASMKKVGADPNVIEYESEEKETPTHSPHPEYSQQKPNKFVTTNDRYHDPLDDKYSSSKDIPANIEDDDDKHKDSKHNPVPPPPQTPEPPLFIKKFINDLGSNPINHMSADSKQTREFGQMGTNNSRNTPFSESLDESNRGVIEPPPGPPQFVLASVSHRKRNKKNLSVSIGKRNSGSPKRKEEEKQHPMSPTKVSRNSKEKSLSPKKQSISSSNTDKITAKSPAPASKFQPKRPEGPPRPARKSPSPIQNRQKTVGKKKTEPSAPRVVVRKQPIEKPRTPELTPTKKIDGNSFIRTYINNSTFRENHNADTKKQRKDKIELNNLKMEMGHYKFMIERDAVSRFREEMRERTKPTSFYREAIGAAIDEETEFGRPSEFERFQTFEPQKMAPKGTLRLGVSRGDLNNMTDEDLQKDYAQVMKRAEDAKISKKKNEIKSEIEFLKAKLASL